MMIEDAGSTVMSILYGLADQSDRKRQLQAERFAQQYSGPLMDFLRRSQGLSLQDAQDTVQGFWMKHLLEPTPQENLVAKYLRKRSSVQGQDAPSFRRYLLRSIKNYSIDRLRSKRDYVALEDDRFVDHGEELVFDSSWANEQLRVVVSSVYKECQRNGQQSMWMLFVHQVLLPGMQLTKPPGYAILSKQFGFSDPKSAANAVRTVIRKFHSHFRRRISDYLPVNEVNETEQRVEEELVDLIRLLGTPGVLDHQLLQELLKECGVCIESPASGSNRHTGSMFSVLHDTMNSALEIGGEATLYQGDDDMRVRWGQLLKTSVNDWLKEWNEEVAVDSITFSDLAAGQWCSEDCLVRLRDCAKRVSHQTSNEPLQIMGLIYLMAIVSGYKYHCKVLSSDPLGRIRKRVELLVNLPWLDDVSVTTLKEFLAATESLADNG